MVVATMARGMLMPLLRLPLMPSLAMATMAVAMDMVVSMVDMADTDTERGRLRLLLMLSPAMATMAVDTDMAAMVDTDVSMVDMEDTDTERGALRLMPSPAMATMAVDTEVMATDVSMVDTDMVADTTDNFLSNSSFLYSNIHSCSKIES